MRKGRNGGKKRKKEKTDGDSGHYIIASSRPPKRQQLERRTLVPIGLCILWSVDDIYSDIKDNVKHGMFKNIP